MPAELQPQTRTLCSLSGGTAAPDSDWSGLGTTNSVWTLSRAGEAQNAILSFMGEENNHDQSTYVTNF